MLDLDEKVHKMNYKVTFLKCKHETLFLTPSEKSNFKLELAMGPNRFAWPYLLYNMYKIVLDIIV